MKTLSSRLTLWYALVVTLTMALLLILGRFYLEHSMLAGIDLMNEVEFEEIRSRIVEAEGELKDSVVEAVSEHADLDAALYFFEVENANEGLIYKSSNLGQHDLPDSGDDGDNVTVTHEELGMLRVSAFDYKGYQVRIASSLNALDVLFDRYERKSGLICGIVFLLSLGFGYFMSRLAMRPIASIQMTARRITASSFSERIPLPNTDDELARMTAFLNDMLDRLEASYEQIKRFTAEASHELRTPLSIIRLQAERLAKPDEMPVAERVDAAVEQLEEIGRLNKLVDDMLLLAKADAGVMPLQCKSVDLDAYGEDFSNDAELLAEEKGVRFELKSTINHAVHFDPVWMRHVFLNLLSNALKFSPSGSIVCLTLGEESGCPVFRMIDEGPGLPESKLETIFDRFERVGAAGDGKDNGLGLAICRSIVQRHGGTILAHNRKDRSGLIVEVRLSGFDLYL